jgi:hypothetical protein
MVYVCSANYSGCWGRRITGAQEFQASLATQQNPTSYWVLMVHTCSPSYSEDQEDRGSKTALANSLRDPILKILNTKKGLAEWLKWKIHNITCLLGLKERSASLPWTPGRAEGFGPQPHVNCIHHNFLAPVTPSSKWKWRVWLGQKSGFHWVPMAHA